MNSQRAIATNIKNFITSVDVRIKRQEATSLQPNQVSYNKQGKMTINAKRPQQTFRSPLLVSCNYLRMETKITSFKQDNNIIEALRRYSCPTHDKKYEKNPQKAQ